MNNDDKIFRHDETCDASRMRERDENNKRMLRKTSHETERSNKKIEKDDRENEKYN